MLPDGAAELLGRIRDRMSVFVGQSGVGKSTLVNRLVPDALRATGDVSKIGKGRHTSSSAVLFDLPGGGTLAFDTEETVRSFAPDWAPPSGTLKLPFAGSIAPLAVKSPKVTIGPPSLGVPISRSGYQKLREAMR